MKKIIIALLTVVMVVCCFSLVACNDKAEQETLKNYIFEQNGTVVTEDFILPSKIGGKDVEWTSDKSEVTLEKRAEDYLAKVNLPESGEVVVKLTVKLGKASKDFTVRVQALSVYDFMDSYKFLKEKATVIADFDLDKTVEYKGKTANITWTVDTDYELYIAINEAGDKCIVTPASKPTAVRIKATFEYNGDTASKSYAMNVYREMTAMEMVDYWYTNTGVSVDMSGYVVLVAEEYNPKYKNIALYMVNDDFTAGYYLYRVLTNETNASLIKPGVHVTVTGTTNTNYNGLIETNQGTGNLVVDKDVPEINVNEHVFAIDELVIGNLPATVYHESRLVSLTNWKVKDVKDQDKIEAGANFTILTITKGGVEVNIRISKYLVGAYKTEKGDSTWEALCGLRETYAAGSTVNVTGIFTKYKDSWQIMPLSADSITAGTTADPDDKKDYVGNKVADAIKAVNSAIKSEGLLDRITANKEVTLPVVSDEVAITYAICGTSKAVVIDGGKITITPDKPENTHVMVTYKIGNFETIQFFYVESLVPTAATMLEDLAVAEKIDKVTDLPIIDGASIVWTVKEGAESLAITNNQLVPTLKEEDVTTIINAELTYDGETRTKDFIVIVKAGKGAVASVAPFEEGKEYILSLNQGQLDKQLYVINEMGGKDNHFMMTTDNPDEAMAVKVEVVDGKYKIYFEKNSAKKYIGYVIADDGKPYVALVDTDAPAWEWDAENKCFRIELTVKEKKEFYYIGTYGKFDTLSLSNISYVKTSFPAFLGTIQFVPLTANEIAVDEASSDKATVTLNETAGLNGQKFTFSVAVADGFEIVSVKVNGSTVEAIDNVYTGVVKGTTTVKVETKEIGAVDPNQPEHAGTLEDPYTCADANKIFATLDKDATYSKDGAPVKVYIKGYVTVVGTVSSNGSYQSKFYLADEKGAAQDASVLVFSANFSEAVKSISMNDQVVVYGYLMDYNGTKEVSYVKVDGKSDYAELVSSVAAEKTDAEKVAEVLTSLTVVQTNFTANGEMVLPTSTNPDVTLAWTSSSEQAVVAADNTKVTFTVTDTTVVATLTVTATCNGASDTKTFDITLGEVPPQVVTVAQALELPDTTKIIVTGVVTTVNEKWSEKYSNITVTITDAEGGELYIYRLATLVGIGDTITVTGEMDTYDNNRQVAAGATATIDAPHVCAEWTEADCVNAPKCTLCAKDKEGATALGHVDENADNLCDRCSTDLSVSYTDEAMDIFANTGVQSEDLLSITWTSTNFTVTGNKNTSKTAIRTTDADHFRVYQGSSLEIAATNDKQIAKIVITCKSADYANVLSGSLTTTGVTATVSDNVVTITVDSGTVTGISFTATAQTRITNVSISYVA